MRVPLESSNTFLAEVWDSAVLPWCFPLKVEKMKVLVVYPEFSNAFLCAWNN